MEIPERILGLLRLLVFGNLWVAFCAVTMYWCTAELHQMEVKWQLSLSIFGATIFIYNYHRLFRKEVIYKGFISQRHRWILNHHKLLQLFAVAGFAVALTNFIPYLNPTLIFRLSPFLLLALLYVIPVWKKEKKWIRIRDIPYIKIFLVAAVWSFVTVFLAFLAEDPYWFPGVAEWSTALQRFIFIFAITLPFDIRDLAHDRSSGLTTFASTLGVQGVKKLSSILLVTSAALAMLSAFAGIYMHGHAGAIILSCLVTGMLISRLDEDSSEWMYAGFLEGTMLDQFIWILLLGALFI